MFEARFYLCPFRFSYHRAVKIVTIEPNAHDGNIIIANSGENNIRKKTT